MKTSINTAPMNSYPMKTRQPKQEEPEQPWRSLPKQDLLRDNLLAYSKDPYWVGQRHNGRGETGLEQATPESMTLEKMRAYLMEKIRSIESGEHSSVEQGESGREEASSRESKGEHEASKKKARESEVVAQPKENRTQRAPESIDRLRQRMTQVSQLATEGPDAAPESPPERKSCVTENQEARSTKKAVTESQPRKSKSTKPAKQGRGRPRKNESAVVRVPKEILDKVKSLAKSYKP